MNKKNRFILMAIPLLSMLVTSCNGNNKASSDQSSDSTSSSSGESSEESSGSSTSGSSASSSGSVSTGSGSMSSICSDSPSGTGHVGNIESIEYIVANGIDSSSYYSGITSQTGEALRTALYNLVKGHKKLSYDYLENYMKVTDRDWGRSPSAADENPYMILLYYTANEDDSKQQLWNHYHTSETKFGVATADMSWDKEHIWAKSNGSFSSSSYSAYSDLHHLRAADMKNNNTRSSLPFAELDTVSGSVNDFTLTASGKKGTADSTSAYEPLDQYKGDIARALLYMATRYSNNDSLKLYLTTGKDSSGGKWGFVADLLKWNLEDAPDEFEIRRNSLVQYYQGNRNPFIDHPEYACRIYSTSSADSSIKAVCGN